MKYSFLLALPFTLALNSCSKDNNIDSRALSKDSNCIEKITIPVTSHGELSTSDYSLVYSLFTNNGIHRPNFRYTRTYKDSINVFLSPYKVESRNVFVIQYANGLPIFTESLNFNFFNGIFQSYSGNLTNGTTLNTTSNSTLGYLRLLFMTDIELFNHNSAQFKDSCFKAEFGYFDLNAGTGNTGENLVKAWHLTPKYSNYPEAYYQDITGQRIYYFDGIEYEH